MKKSERGTAQSAAPLSFRFAVRPSPGGFSTAYIAPNGFRKLPTAAAAEAWATLARAWQHMKKPVTVESLRTQMYTIVRTRSRPLDGARLIGNEIAPRFDLAAHDAACDCGRPEIKLSEHVKPGPRCYKPARWEALQAEANKGNRKATGNGTAGTTNGSKPSVTAAPVPVYPRRVCGGLRGLREQLPDAGRGRRPGAGRSRHGRGAAGRGGAGRPRHGRGAAGRERERAAGASSRSPAKTPSHAGARTRIAARNSSAVSIPFTPQHHFTSVCRSIRRRSTGGRS
jgi:hypothetical protein